MPPLRSRTVTHGRNAAGAIPREFSATAFSGPAGAARDIALIDQPGP
jgi:hypothetical protein